MVLKTINESFSGSSDEILKESEQEGHRKSSLLKIDEYEGSKNQVHPSFSMKTDIFGDMSEYNRNGDSFMMKVRPPLRPTPPVDSLPEEATT